MRIAVLGAGMMGRAAVYDLAQNKDIEEIVLGDVDVNSAIGIKEFVKERLGYDKVTPKYADFSNRKYGAAIMKGCDAAISAVTYRFNYDMACAALEEGVNFCDMGGNNDVVRSELNLDKQAKDAGITIIPDCGLAPGMVSILSADALTRFDEVHDLKLRVGGLPQNPQGPLNYMIVFSPTGLINEYKEDTVLIKEGKVVVVPSMADLEEIVFPEPFGKLEAFNTSGGASTLPQTLLGKVKNLDYKTIRYKGHCEKMNFLLGLGLADETPFEVNNTTVRPRDIFERQLAKSLAYEDKDLILLRVTANGLKDGKEKNVTYECIDFQDDKTGLTAMMRMTAFPVSIIAQMMATGEISEKGAIPQELCVPPQGFIEEVRKRGIDLDIRES